MKLCLRLLSEWGEHLSKEVRTAEEILHSAGVLDQVKMKESLLISIAKSIIRDKSMDRDTIIYRLAMMLYHSALLAGAPLIGAVEDAGYIYLKLMEDREIAGLFEEKLKKSKFADTPSFTKTFICFAIAAYIYYKATA